MNQVLFQNVYHQFGVWIRKTTNIDLLQVNNYICDNNFTSYEGINVVKEQIKFKDKLVTYDLKDVFYHIPIHPDYYTYLGIQWKAVYYMWAVLPFWSKVLALFFSQSSQTITTIFEGERHTCSDICR